MEPIPNSFNKTVFYSLASLAIIHLLAFLYIVFAVGGWGILLVVYLNPLGYVVAGGLFEFMWRSDTIRSFLSILDATPLLMKFFGHPTMYGIGLSARVLQIYFYLKIILCIFIYWVARFVERKNIRRLLKFIAGIILFISTWFFLYSWTNDVEDLLSLTIVELSTVAFLLFIAIWAARNWQKLWIKIVTLGIFFFPIIYFVFVSVFPVLSPFRGTSW